MRSGWYQAVGRGLGEEGIYRTDEDQLRFLGRVAELPERSGAEIHAFVLMENLQESGREGTMVVATPHLGWRLVDGVRELPGLKDAAATQLESPVLASGGGRHRFVRRSAVV